MIKFENTEVFNFESAFRGLRNPLNSWDKSDSDLQNGILGKNDLDLAQRLIKAGSEHRKFLRQIFISVDITAPLYWWKEFDTYKIGTVANSCSTMHKIHSKEFTLDDFSTEHLNKLSLEYLNSIIERLNECRLTYLISKEKDWWWQLIQLLPTSYNQKRTITMNYENVLSIAKQRKGHKLDEWNDFINWAKGLPYAKELLFIE